MLPHDLINVPTYVCVGGGGGECLSIGYVIVCRYVFMLYDTISHITSKLLNHHTFYYTNCVTNSTR